MRNPCRATFTAGMTAELLTAHQADAGPHASRPAAPRQMRRRDEIAFVVFSTWTISGLFLDGWSHRQGKPETFFTPWHGLLYSGFIAGMLWTALERIRAARRGETLPETDRLVPVGGLLFLIAGIGDMVWHMIFGIEEDLEALLSPTHLLLMVAGLLLTTAPLRGPWRTAGDTGPPRFSTVAPKLAAVTLSAALVSFFLMFASPLPRNEEGFGDLYAAHGAASVLLTSVVVLLPLIWLASRMALPVGAPLVHLMTVFVFTLALDGFERWPLLLAAAAGGAAGEATRRNASRDLGGLATFSAAIAATTWTGYYAVEAAVSGIGLTVELWTGPIALATLAAIALATILGSSGRPTAPTGTSARA